MTNPSNLAEQGAAGKDVAALFESPWEIAEAQDLSREEKLKLLTSWEQDLRLKLVASEENMQGQSPGRSAEMLSEVRQALHNLDAADLKPPAPSKLG